MTETAAILYTALCPEPATRQRVEALVRQVKHTLGEDFIPQHPANLHLTTGKHRADALPQGFPAGDSHKIPRVDSFAPPLAGDKGNPHLELFFRPDTQEFSLALCLPFTAAEAWKSAGHSKTPSPPHITLGKLALDAAQNTAETRHALKAALQAANGLFVGFDTIADAVRQEYAENGAFRFDAAYLAPADGRCLSVPRGPMIPAHGQSAAR